MLNPKVEYEWGVDLTAPELCVRKTGAQDIWGFNESLANEMGEIVWDEDFSKLSPHQCHSLMNSTWEAGKNVTTSCPVDNYRDTRVVDQDYIMKLERRLKRLYSVKGYADRLSMIKQLKDRTDFLFNQNEVTSFSSEEYKEDATNFISRKLFPDQQAIYTEEKLPLVKNDTLDVMKNEVDA